VIMDESVYLAHYGILRRSGRYPWGSGGNQSTRNRTFLNMVDDLRRKGHTETQIAEGFGLTTTQLRAAKSIAKAQQKQEQITEAQRLHDKGMSNIAIGKKMGINESSVRALLAPGQKDKADVLEATSNMLKKQVAEKTYLDVGAGTERLPQIGVSQTKLNTAIARLQEEGYVVHYVKVEQLGTGKNTTMKVLTAPGVSYGQVYRNRDNIRGVSDYSEDGGRTFLGIQPPLSISSKRLEIRYAEDGGSKADGVVYVRPGVKDVSLGSNRYAQVRIAIDGTHFIKGMAMYRDDLPPGVDLVFNTNKSNTGHKLDALKPLKADKDNPFGAVIARQITEPARGGKHKVTSAMNIVNDESDWETWSRSLSSQFLSKQSPKLAKTQLNMTYERKKQELDGIMQLTNPAVRRKLLDAFADSADASAVHLKAAALPRQKTHVILPVESMRDTEVYAPNFNNGERVVLIRHPHGGLFELPELTVNNKNPEAKRLLGQSKNAIGINSKVAQHLSGADFDGDTVIVVPNPHGSIKTKSPLKELTGFDHIKTYRLPDDSPIPRMSAKTKQHQMGVVSNLITDMTIRGANDGELARAVRHSMVVIDAEKHNLNYRQSALDNGIAQLSEKYQGKKTGGAKTLISRASSEVYVPERKQGYTINPRTGEKIHRETGATYVNARGQTISKTTKSTKLAETKDAHTLSSGTPIEKIYADHSNSLKALANQARLASHNTKTTPYSPSAKTAYSKEVASLNSKLNIALRNAPFERQAQVFANAIVKQKRDANPDMDRSDLKKIKGQALAEARTRTGARKTKIEITDSEWAAIQAGAISNHKLSQILDNADLDVVKSLATPKRALLMTPTKTSRAHAMLASGYTQAEVAAALGVSLTTLKDSLR